MNKQKRRYIKWKPTIDAILKKLSNGCIYHYLDLSAEMGIDGGKMANILSHLKEEGVVETPVILQTIKTKQLGYYQLKNYENNA